MLYEDHCYVTKKSKLILRNSLDDVCLCERAQEVTGTDVNLSNNHWELMMSVGRKGVCYFKYFLCVCVCVFMVV